MITSVPGLTPYRGWLLYGGPVEEFVRSPWRLGSRVERWFDGLLVLVLMGPVPVFVVICASCALQVLLLDGRVP